MGLTLSQSRQFRYVERLLTSRAGVIRDELSVNASRNTTTYALSLESLEECAVQPEGSRATLSCIRSLFVMSDFRLWFELRSHHSRPKVKTSLAIEGKLLKPKIQAHILRVSLLI